MGEKHKLGQDGVLEDGVSFYPADTQDLQSYRDARQQLAQLRVPVLVHRDNPHERLYIPAFDGTGNDAEHNPEHATNVARIHWQVAKFNEQGFQQVASGYVEGPGTQENFFVRTWDGARGHTYDERLEKMYKLLINQAWEWRQADPDVQIRIAPIGFSRGAEQAAGFARLVHERGIQDPSGAVYARDCGGQIVGVTYTKPPLVAAGQTAQAMGLFDPVGTGEPIEKHDRRLPPSAISRFQLVAEDEHRSQFRSSPIVAPGSSADNQSYSVMVGGAHSDIGGGYHHDGLSARSGNLMAIYLNGLSDTPFLQYRAEPDDPHLNVVHRSEEGLFGLYKLSPLVDRRTPEGVNERLVPKELENKVTDAYQSEPIDYALAAQFEFRPIGPVPPARQPTANDPAAIVDRLLTAAASGDRAAFRDATRSAADHDAARELREHAVTAVDQHLASAQQQTTQQQAAQHQNVQSHEAPARRHAVPMH